MIFQCCTRLSHSLQYVLFSDSSAVAVRFLCKLDTVNYVGKPPTYDCSGSCGDDKPLSASSRSETETPSSIVADDNDNDAAIKVRTMKMMNQ